MLPITKYAVFYKGDQVSPLFDRERQASNWFIHAPSKYSTLCLKVEAVSFDDKGERIKKPLTQTEKNALSLLR